MKNLTLRLLPLFMMCLLLAESHAQNRSGYQLLWKISGKNLSRPSYLFGTMHLKDKRVYDFSDSVLVKLDECEGFAMEILPDSIVKAMFTQLLDSKLKKKDLKEELSEQEYKVLNERLQKEAGVPLEGIKSQDPWIIQSLLNKTAPKKDDKATFLDAYLYQLARQQGKQLSGLEQVSDQTGLFTVESLKEHINYSSDNEPTGVASVEKFIEVYHSGDINRIYEMVTAASAMSPNFEDTWLVKRNLNMAKKMETLMAQQSTFVAVGAAHLPGQKGLINLLREQGYTVTPVQATFTGMAAAYREKTVELPWYQFEQPENGYAVEFPSQPYPYEYQSGVTMFVLPDLGNGMVYFSFGFVFPAGMQNAPQEDELFDKMIKSMTQRQAGNQILSVSKITVEGSPGREVEVYNSTENQYVKCRVSIKGRQVYMLMIAGKKEQITSAGAKRFMESFRTFKPVAPKDSELISAEGAFSVEAPVKLTYSLQKNKSEEGIESVAHLFVGEHNATGLGYIVMYKDQPKGYVIGDENLFFEQIVAHSKQSIQAELVAMTPIEYEGITGREVHLTATDYDFRGRYFLRGSRLYAVVLTGSKKTLFGIDGNSFLESFHFRDYQPVKWENYTNTTYGFTAKVPSGNPSVKVDQEDNLKVFYAQNPASGLSYTTLVKTYSPYYQGGHQDSVFNELRDSYRNENTLLVTEQRITVDGQPGYEFVSREQGSNQYKKIKMVLRGRFLYVLMVVSSQSDLSSPMVSTFFDSFHLVEGSITPGNLFSPKTDLILADIAAADTAVSNEAIKALPGYRFKAEEMPKIYKALQRTYPGDTAEYKNPRSSLLRALEEIGDEKTVDFIREFYPSVSQYPVLQSASMRLLGNLNSKSSLTLMKQLLLQRPLRFSGGNVGTCFYSVLDSMSNVKYLLPDLLQLADQPDYMQPLYHLAATALDNGYLSAQEIAPYYTQIIAQGQKAAAESKNKDDYMAPYGLSLVSQLLGYLPEKPESIALLKQSAKHEYTYVSFSGVVALARLDRVSKKQLEGAAKNPATRTELYEQLTAMKKGNLFPSKYKTQQHFSEAYLMKWLTDNESEPSAMKLLEKRTVEYKGKKGVIYIYHLIYKYEGQTDEFVGVSGLFSGDENSLSVDEYVVGSNFKSLAEQPLEEQLKMMLSEE